MLRLAFIRSWALVAGETRARLSGCALCAACTRGAEEKPDSGERRAGSGVSERRRPRQLRAPLRTSLVVATWPGVARVGRSARARAFAEPAPGGAGFHRSPANVVAQTVASCSVRRTQSDRVRPWPDA